MTIVFYSHSPRLGAGAEESLLSIVRELSKRHSCYVVVPGEGDMANELKKHGVKTLISTYPWTSNSYNQLTYKHPRNSFRLLKNQIKRKKQLKKTVKEQIPIIRKIKPDLIYSNTSVINIGLQVAKKLNVKHIWHLREHQAYDNEVQPDFGRFYFKKLLNSSDVVIVNSILLQKFYKKLIPNKKINVIYNGISLENSFKKSEEVSSKPYSFIVVGRMSQHKNFKTVVKALKILLEKGLHTRLLIVGDEGSQSKELREFVQINKMKDYVDFIGQKKDVTPYYNMANCYIMCSKKETFGRVTVEAMLHQLPVIGVNNEHNAVSEIIRNGIDGVLYEDNHFDLANKMEQAYFNQNKFKEMGENGHQRAKDMFSMKRMVDELEELMLNLKL